MKFNYSSYLSPFSWRYGSKRMRQIFSEEKKYRLWRKIWLALARVQYKDGIVSDEEFRDLEEHELDIDIRRILEIEKEINHDVMAAIREFAEKAKIGGGKIHLGATSMDVVDNADVLRMKEALLLIKKRILFLLSLFAEKIERYASLACIGYTHLQPAEPTTVGYRIAFYAQDLLTDYDFLLFVERNLKGKGIKGAVGTAASYTALTNGDTRKVERMEIKFMRCLGIKSSLISTQIYSRKLDFLVLSVLASISSCLAKFAGDLRILQSAAIGEWSEPFEEKQVGSSAMPFKKNPVSSENICSLARYVSKLSNIALDNATLSYLERTLDDSANRRIIIPEAFLATDQMLITTEKILKGFIVNKKRVSYNLQQYGPFAATEAILMEAVKNGANRQEMHEHLRLISMDSWKSIHNGEPNPLRNMLIKDTMVGKYLTANEIDALLNVSKHLGNAPQRARRLAKELIIKTRANQIG